MKTIKMLLLFAAVCVFFAIPAFAQNDYSVLQRESTVFTTTQTSNSQRIKPDFSIVAKITVVTPSAIAFTCATTDICTTATAHGFETGLKLQVATTTTLPTGLSGSTDYFVIKLSTTTFSLATSLANAQAGTVIDITGAGSGTHTATPTALAGGTIAIQGSLDCTNFATLQTATNVTATGNVIWNLNDQQYNCVRTSTTLTAGQLTAEIQYVGRP